MCVGVFVVVWAVLHLELMWTKERCVTVSGLVHVGCILRLGRESQHQVDVFVSVICVFRRGRRVLLESADPQLCSWIHHRQGRPDHRAAPEGDRGHYQTVQIQRLLPRYSTARLCPCLMGWLCLCGSGVKLWWKVDHDSWPASCRLLINAVMLTQYRAVSKLRKWPSNQTEGRMLSYDCVKRMLHFSQMPSFWQC